MCPLSDESARLSVVLDREADQEKSLDPSRPRIRCPLCGWSPRKDDCWSCTCGHSCNTFNTEKCAPPVSAGGLQHSVFPVAAGRHIPTGIPSHEMFEATI